MTKKQMISKIIEVQEMGNGELVCFEKKVLNSDLEAFKKELLLKAIAVRRSKNVEVSLAMVEMGETDDMGGML